MNKPHSHQSSLDQSVPLQPLPPSISPLTVENVLWSNTVLAGGICCRLCYLHRIRDSSRHEYQSPGNEGWLLDLEINKLAKVRFGILFL